MAATLLRGIVRKLVVANIAKMKVLPQKTFFPQTMTVRGAGNLLPASQYDMEWPKKMGLHRLMTHNFELWPLFGCTALGIAFPIVAIIWAVNNKVDVVFRTHSRKNISRTMDLLNPTCHKMLCINQTCKPWPKMYQVFVKMRKQENRLRELRRGTTA